MRNHRAKKPLGHTVWFKVILTITIFFMYSEVSFDPVNTSDVITEVLSHPLAVSVPALLPLAKLLLLAAVLIPFLPGQSGTKFLLGYYAFILMVVGLFQNTAYTENYGFVWLYGNTLVQLAVAAYCIYDLVKGKSQFTGHLNKQRLWVIAPMLLAFLMPFTAASGLIKPAFTSELLLNEAGVTYCMITPVVLGVMIVFSEGVHKPLLSVVSYVGFIFGMLNMMTWFVMQSQNWWMGVIHLPLLILSFCGLLISRARARHTAASTLSS